MPKRKLKELKQTDGKLSTPLTLDQIWGDTGLWKYKTLDIEEYKNTLNTMNFAELQEHAKTLGLMPIDDQNRLKKTLLEEFNAFARTYKKVPPVRSNNDITKLSPEARKILAEAK